jgi:hypothetical protein
MAVSVSRIQQQVDSREGTHGLPNQDDDPSCFLLVGVTLCRVTKATTAITVLTVTLTCSAVKSRPYAPANATPAEMTPPINTGSFFALSIVLIPSTTLRRAGLRTCRFFNTRETLCRITHDATFDFNPIVAPRTCRVVTRSTAYAIKMTLP